MRIGLPSVPFEILQEQWNEYIFSDQVVVKTRLILISIIQELEFEPFILQTERLTAVSAHPYVRAEPTECEQGSDSRGGAKQECPILLRYERWNKYTLADLGIELKMIFVARKASRVLNMFDSNGQPIYIIDGKPLIKYAGDVSEDKINAFT